MEGCSPEPHRHALIEAMWDDREDKEATGENEENDENRNARTVCSGGNDDYHKDADTYCTFDKTLLGDCAEYPYGYGKDNFKPCVFLKMNRIWNLEPKPITAESTIDQSVVDLDTDKFLGKIENLGTFVSTCIDNIPAVFGCSVQVSNQIKSNIYFDI